MANGTRLRARFTSVRRLFVVVGVLAVGAGAANVVVAEWTSPPEGSVPFDFDLNWVAAHRLLDREPLYDRAASKADGLRLVGAEMRAMNANPFSSFIGLPTTALLYAPFTAFNAARAADLYQLANFVAMLVAIGITLLALPPPSRLPAGLFSVGALMLSTPVDKSVWLGQVDGFVMVGLAVAIYGVARARWRVVGIGLAVAALLKLSPALLIVYLALRRKWEAVAAAAVTAVVLLGVAASVGRPGDVFTWFTSVAGDVGGGARSADNQSLPAALARLFTGNDLVTTAPLAGWRWVSVVVAGLGVGALWWTRRKHPIEPLDFGVLVLVALLAGPISWDHYLTWTLLVLVLVADARRWAGRTWAEVVALAVPLGAAVLLMRTNTTFPDAHEVDAHWYLHVTTSSKTLAVLLVLGVALWLLYRPAPDDSATAPATDATVAAPVAAVDG